MSNTTTPGSKDRRLGRGLAALLGTPLDEQGNPLPENAGPHPGGPAGRRPASGTSATAAAPSDDQAAEKRRAGDTATGDAVAAGLRSLELSVHEIDNNPFQPRREFSPSEIASLAESLKTHDQLQPVLVRRVGERFQLISGERRLRAAIHAGLATVRAEVREADDRLVAELAIIENLQRKDLNAVEKALSFRRYIDQHGCTQEELAGRLSIDRSTVANLMRLLELPQPILDALNAERITAGHARALLPLGDERQQIQLARQIEEERWSVRATELHITELLRAEDEAEAGESGPASAKKRRTVTPQVESLQQELRMQLGTKVEIRQTARGRGKITIHFANADEFDRLRSLMASSSAAKSAA